MSLKTIPTVFISTLIFIFIIQPCVMALDDTPSLQCNGGIVAPGDSEDSVREKCGEAVGTILCPAGMDSGECGEIIVRLGISTTD